MTPDLTLNFGGRFDVVNAFTNENQFSPRINGVWKATPTTTLHAGYANYFTPPPLELVSSATISKFVGTTAEPEVLQNSPVKAERAHYFDIGLDQEILPGTQRGDRRLLQVLAQPDRRGPVRRAGHPDGIQLSQRPEPRRRAHRPPTTPAISRPTAISRSPQQKAEGIVSAQFNFGADELAFIASHQINTDHSQSLTASGGLSYLWRDTGSAPT